MLDAAASGGPEMASAVLVVPRQVAADLIERVDPRLAVYIAVGSARDQPSADLLAALSGVTLLRTDERGRVDVVVDGAGMRVGTGR